MNKLHAGFDILPPVLLVLAVSACSSEPPKRTQPLIRNPLLEVVLAKFQEEAEGERNRGKFSEAGKLATAKESPNSDADEHPRIEFDGEIYKVVLGNRVEIVRLLQTSGAYPGLSCIEIDGKRETDPNMNCHPWEKR